MFYICYLSTSVMYVCNTKQIFFVYIVVYRRMKFIYFIKEFSALCLI